MERRRGLPVQRTATIPAAGALCHLPETGSHRPATSQWSIDATSVLRAPKACRQSVAGDVVHVVLAALGSRLSATVEKMRWPKQGTGPDELPAKRGGSRDGVLNMQCPCHP